MTVQASSRIRVSRNSFIIFAVLGGWLQPLAANAQEERVGTALLQVSQPAPFVVEEGYQRPTEQEWARFPDMQAEELVDELERLCAESAELQARREDLARQAELVDQMAQKLSAWDLQLTRGTNIRILQDAQVETMDGNQ